ncbi:MAG: Fe(3+) ABC transporter substrate-binding protein [Phototrophicales bacterium]|nr:MAG: Fe(3+) ABC transporter substrate-binding protein [Phototrophicales bacterium]
MRKLVLSILIGVLALGGVFLGQPNQEPVAEARGGRVLNIYSSRHYGALEAPFVAFQEATGIEVRVSDGEPRALLERLRAEGDRTPADIFLAIDAGVLSLAAEEGLLQPVESEILLNNIDESQRDPENRWFGLSQRVRTIAYNPEVVDPSELSTYEALADPQWKDRLCLRPASHIYTVSLVSSLIYHHGYDEALEIVKGWVANNPTYINSDTRIIETIVAGGCDVGIVNHYYLARLKSQDPEYPAALFWANQDASGTFYNVNGAGITANARNYDEAVEFLEFMSSLEGQAGTPEGLPGVNFEFPTNPEAELNEILAQFIEEFGEFELDLEYPLWEYGNYQEDAVRLLEEAGYGFDEG